MKTQVLLFSDGVAGTNQSTSAVHAETEAYATLAVAVIPAPAALYALGLLICRRRAAHPHQPASPSKR